MEYVSRLSPGVLGSCWLGAGLALCTVCFAQGAARVDNLVRNPSAEETADGKPVGWGMYRGKGTSSWGVSDDAHTGRRAAYLRIEAFGEWQGEPYVNAGLLPVDSNGYDGSRALPAEPATDYHFSFWLKGDLPSVQVSAYVWSTEEATNDTRSSVSTTLRRVTPSDRWTQYEGTFTTRPDSRRFALHFHVFGHPSEGMTTGTILVDDVSIEQRGSIPQTPPQKRIVLPSELSGFIDGRSLADLADALRAGEPEAVALVSRTLERAEKWADKDDSWFVERTAAFTPVGLWTVACPFHPERVRDFSPDNFEWSIDDPWKLDCRLCREEGRELHSYPNERYPDDGTGCYPTDDVWREDHDAAWSKAHGGIPWDHWDGSPHGYSAAGYCYYFLGKCAHLIMSFECDEVLPALAEGYAVARHVLPAGDPRRERADTYARRVKVAMLCLARAHLGDAYLARAAGLSEADYDTLLMGFHTDDPQGLAAARLPGYTSYGLQDGIVGDPKHPPRGRPDIYADGSFRGDKYAREWLRAYALVRDAYTEDEEPVRRITERLLVSAERDAEALADAGEGAKKGKLEYALRPYDLTVGHSNNLGGRELAGKFEFGRLLGDKEAVDAVVSNIRYYLRNYFTGDGLGREGTGAYTTCAWNTLSMALSRIYGYRGHYDDSHPWWDPDLDGLNPYRDPYLRTAAAKLVLSLYPNGRLIPWMDSHVDARLALTYIEQAEDEGGGLPEQYAGFFAITRDETGRSTAHFREPLDLPSILHHELRKAVLRSGRGDQQALLSVDYALDSGHWHPAPMDLVLFAHGHELASDLGYFGAMSSLTRNWIRACEAHNTCLIRSTDGDHKFLHQVQGDIREVASLGGSVQVVEVAEHDPEMLAAIPGATPRYARTTALVALDEAAPYAVDLFRVRGGGIHDYMFHSAGRQLTADGIGLQAGSDAALSLYDVSGFTCRQPADSGSRAIKQVRRAATADTFSLTWTRVPDWARGGDVDESVGLRLTMLGHPGTDVLVGVAPGQRRMSNLDLGEKLHVACIRRANTDATDVFAAVIEPYRQAPFIRAVRALPVTGASDAVAVEIELPGRTDLILSNPPGEDGRQVVGCPVSGNVQLDTDAAFAFVSVRGGTIGYVQIVGATHARLGERELDVGAPLRGAVVSFDDDRDALVVETEDVLPEGTALRDATIIVRHARGTSTFTIDGVAPLGDSRYELALRWTPHLGENYFRVIDAQGSWVRLQPPPSLPRSFERLGYQVYTTGPAGEATHCGEVARRAGEWYEVSGDLRKVSVGSDVMLTRLTVARDEFLIPNRLIIGPDERRG